MTQLGQLPADEYGITQLPEAPPANTALIEANFTEEDADRVHERLRSRFNNGQGMMRSHHKNAEINNRLYKMLARKTQPKYQGEPLVTTPLTHDKSEDLFAQLYQTVDQETFWAHKGESVKDREVTMITEKLMNSLIMSDPRTAQNIKAGSLKKAIIEGTCFGYISLVRLDGRVIPKPEVISISDVITDQSAVDDLSNSFVAIKRTYNMYMIEDMVTDGQISEQNYNDMKARMVTPSREFEANRKFRQNSVPGAGPTIHDDENQVVELYECWIEYRRKDSAPGEEPKSYMVLYECYSDSILNVIENPFAEAFSGPPITPIRIAQDCGYLFGFSVPDALKTYQRMADEGLYTHLKLNQFAADPPFLYYKNSPFAKSIQSNSLTPGQGFPVSSQDRVTENLHYMEFGNNGLAIQDLQLANQMAEQATFQQEGGGGSRQSRGEYMARLQIANFKINLKLKQYSLDMATFGDMIYGAICAFYVKPNGIVEVDVGNGSKYLAWDEVETPQIFDMVFREAALQAPQNFDEMIQTIGQAYLELNEKLTKNTIPSCRNGSIKICLSGDRGVEDKQIEAQKYQQLGIYLEAIASINPPGVWYYLKRAMETMGISDWRDLIGEDPTGAEQSEFFQIMAERIADRQAQSSVL